MADKPTPTVKQPMTYEEHQHSTIQSPFFMSTSLVGPITPAENSQAVLATPKSVKAMGKKPLDISNLMSPPEPIPFETFGLPGQPAPSVAPIPAKPSAHHPMSPPISPFTISSSNLDPASAIPLKDPILYPIVDGTSALLAQPKALFSAHVAAETARLIQQHIETQDSSTWCEVSPPKVEDYGLVMHFQSKVWGMFQQNPRAWLRLQRESLRADRPVRKQSLTQAKNWPVNNAPVKIAPAPHRSKTSRTPTKVTSTGSPGQAPSLRVRKPTIKNMTTIKIMPPKVTAKAAKVARAAQASPTPTRPLETPVPGIQTPTSDAQGSIQGVFGHADTPEPRIRVVAPSREDKEWWKIQDFCPPLHSLPINKPNCLKVDWKGNALDLSNDPNKHHLHPDEIMLASGLRLDCATYLTSKRRIFERRLQCAKQGKEFRKTDAQQACKIDVNKASKLWTAYEKVGWLSVDWMRKSMEQFPAI